MVMAIRTYNSVEEISKALDTEIADIRGALGEYLRKLDAIRNLAEKSKKVRQIVMKLSGKKNGYTEDFGEIEVGNIKIVLDAKAENELEAMEDAIRSHQEYLAVLQKAREALKLLDQLGDTEGLNFIVLEKQGEPQRILFKSF
jgi:hypothetical protein